MRRGFKKIPAGLSTPTEYRILVQSYRTGEKTFYAVVHDGRFKHFLAEGERTDKYGASYRDWTVVPLEEFASLGEDDYSRPRTDAAGHFHSHEYKSYTPLQRAELTYETVMNHLAHYAVENGLDRSLT